MDKVILKILFFTLVIILKCLTISNAKECDAFVEWVDPVKDTYMEDHLVYPIPEDIQKLAIRYMPRLWVHPESWHPIAFEQYLSQSKLVRRSDNKTLIESPSAEAMAALSKDAQCDAFLEAHDVDSILPAPLYVQVFRDHSPISSQDNWIYIKYNPVFDWSGLPHEISWIGTLGKFLVGGDKKRWHRLDVHTAAILAFDSKRRFRMLTLAQHNHQHTYIPGRDFPVDQAPMLVAAVQSNELYLDNGESTPVKHRIVPFFNKVSYLIDPKEKPWLWGIDLTYGSHAGGKEIKFHLVFLEPKHPLADFAGLLAPPQRIFGVYFGRDGPPGYNYYAPPSYIPLPNFAAMGFWQAGNMELLNEIAPLLKGVEDTDWEGLVRIMCRRLRVALME